jgi:polyferredoxin
VESDEAIPVRRRSRRPRPLWLAIWAVILVSVLLAMFVHRGFLGIVGLIGAAIVAVVMVRNVRDVATADESD